MNRGLLRVCVVVAVLAVGAGAAGQAEAQETRAGLIEAKQAEKAKTAEPFELSRIEKFVAELEQNVANPPSGLYPVFGGIYQGSGLALGAGYRKFFARNSVWNVTGLYSIKSFKQVEVGTRTPWNGSGLVTYGIRAGFLDAPQVSYFGQGMVGEGRTSFGLTKAYGGAELHVRPSNWARLEAQVMYEDYDTKAGRGRHPSIETIYSPATAPGLTADPTFIRTEALAAIDWRTSGGYSRTGGFYGVTLANYTDPDETFSFRRAEGEIIQHVPILRENWVLSFRGRVETILDDEDTVPYFMLPQLGSSRTLRGYSTGRFRDRHSILTSAEFRWIPNRMALDMAIFYDAGKVTNRREDLDLNGLKSDWGIGMRFHGPTATVLRMEAARGTDGWRLVFATNAAF